MTDVQHCQQPGCTGVIEDGYCNVCGSPASPTPLPPASGTGTAAAASPSAKLGTGFAAGPQTGAGPDADFAQAGSTRTGRTSSSRLATAALGSARTAATGSKATRRFGTTSTRLRGPRLGAGLTTVPTEPPTDPLKAVMAVAELPESKRFCSNCGKPVGRGRDDKPGRTEGFCPNCRTPFSFTPSSSPATSSAGSTRSSAASPSAGSAGSTSPATRTCRAAGSC